MRRKDREVKDLAEIEQIIAGCKVCHIAMAEEGKPYLVPMNFGYELKEGILTLYFHSAREGKKIDVLKANGNVWFEMCIEGGPVYAKDIPCNSGFYYQSVMGSGKAEFVTDVQEKCKGLSLLMKQIVNAEVDFNEAQADMVSVIKIVSKDFTGKKKAVLA